MRERAGTRIEYAQRPRRTSLTVLVAAAGAAAALLVATPTDAAPLAGASVTAATARPETAVRGIDVPGVDVGDQASAMRTSGRQLVARLPQRATSDFGLVALTWAKDSAPADTEVEVRTHGDRGWSGWHELHVHPGEEPAPSEVTADVRDGTEPLWVGDADGVGARVFSAHDTGPRDIEVTLVDPGDSQALSGSTSTSTTASTSAGSTRRPRLVSRRGWGADPRLTSRCDRPRRAKTVQMTFVHHTVGTNNYRRSESRSIVRGIYAYHTQGRGWCDIGYNFLVDRYGTAFVGRRGGPNVPVRGAHAGDYNLRTVGVSLMGNFEKARPTRAMKRKLTHLLAWKLSSYYRYPHTKARVAGRTFEKISGHRDAMATACPGRFVYRWLPRLRDRVVNRAGRIETPISRKWQRMRRNGTRIGQPYRGEAGAPKGGRKTLFGRGRGWIFWDDGPGAHAVLRGPISTRYRKYGRAAGRLGYPRTDRWQIKGHRGSGQTFQRGRIYRTPRHGAVAIWGRVNRRYGQEGLAGGRLGVPVRNQYRVSSGWRGRFQHGWITWNTSTGRTSVRYF
ncbi:MAG: N-acetylmuramoyl-L-alanine amidase [Nocardioidaceae bacterium]